jgi:predicted nucleic acid-binding protein
VRGLLDTSVFIADEQGRPLARERIPDETAISVVTLAELELGVHMASDESVRSHRLRTLQSARAVYEPLAVDAEVASTFAELVATARRDGRRPKVQDTGIAATARRHGVPVITQDRDYRGLEIDVVVV